MILFLLAYLGGVLTILSPCILPVLPFVFASAGRPFLRHGLPMLAGMALTFAAIATLAAVGGGWAVEANRYGRIAALVLLAGFGLVLLFPALSERLTRPVVALGNRLSQAADKDGGSSVLAPALLGVATGLLWAPCAGPILGLILTGAALQGASLKTSFLLLAYAAGAADITCAGAPRRRADLRRHEAISWRRGVDQAWPGSSRAGWRRGNRVWFRYGLSDARFARKHGGARTRAGR